MMKKTHHYQPEVHKTPKYQILSYLKEYSGLHIKMTTYNACATNLGSQESKFSRNYISSKF